MREVESVWRRFGGIKNTVVLAPGIPQPLGQPFINVPIFHDDFIFLYIGNGCETPNNHPFETGGPLGLEGMKVEARKLSFLPQKLGKPWKKDDFFPRHLYGDCTKPL